MTAWRDGMGRLNVKYPTGTAKRYEAVLQDGRLVGICRGPGWVVIQGEWAVTMTGIDMAAVRVFHMQQARLKRRPGSERNLKYHLHTAEEAV